MTCPVCRADRPEGNHICPTGAARAEEPGSQPIDSLQIRLQKAVEGQYAVLRLLGRGGMAAVYLARDRELDRLVALKVLPPDVGGNAESRARFRREARLAAKLTHPNIVPLHSFGESDGLMYFVMGYVCGESLADRLRREGRISQEESRLKLAQLCEALEYAHGKGVIHRDIKPDNILLDDETGQPLLADFGIARAAGHGGTVTEVVGTVHYMSPEQAIGATSVDGRSDLYSLGVVGYVMLAGQTPYDARTFAAFVAQQAGADPPPLVSRVPDIAPDLGAAIMRCLAREVTSRWSDARAFKQSLGAALEDDSERLPGELREVTGALFWSLVLGWIAANIAARALPVSVFGWWPVLCAVFLPAALYVTTAAVHIRKGFSWADMGRVAVWPPPWWPFWWPAAWRRPEDLWPRLPLTVRRVRMVYGVIASSVLLALPLALPTGHTCRLFQRFRSRLVRNDGDDGVCRVVGAPLGHPEQRGPPLPVSSVFYRSPLLETAADGSSGAGIRRRGRETATDPPRVCPAHRRRNPADDGSDT